MEVAITNNHSQSHHPHPHHQHHQRLASAAPQHSHQLLPHQSGNSGSGDGARSPFQREVREWQRIDPDTGALLSGRLEADRWINGPLNSYGKISDSQNISQPNGTQHTQRKQLEVLQARTAAGGAMQVIRSQTVQTTSSRWSSASASATPSPQLALTNGTPSSYHNHSHYHNHSAHSQPHPHLAETQTSAAAFVPRSWLNPPPTSAIQMSGVDICEVSDDDDRLEADQNYLINSSSSGSGNSFLNRNSFTHGNGSNSNSNSNSNNSSNSNLGSSNLLLLDTAPSLKLSNLMKSSSSISSSSTNSTTAATATTLASTTTAAPAAAAMNNSNTHKSAGKISLHAIVGSNSSSSNSTSDTKSSATTSTTSWQQQQLQQQQQQQRSSRLFEQASLFGKRNNNSNSNSNSLTKSRVGVTTAADRDFDDENDDETGGRGGAGGGFGDAVAATASYADEQLRHHRHQRQSNNDELTPTHCRHRDLESFRHYNDHGIAASTSASNDIDDDDHDQHSSSRYQRRQQNPLNSHSALQRSRSISTDDLSTEWDTHGGATEEPSEWRRVSKLRRSFQSSSTTNNESYKSPTIIRRPPLDLPTNSVSVSRIRAELENGRRLNTAMRNNHVDLAALDTLLNAATLTEMKPSPTKRTTYNLTAESLKEIRGKLKKLSDESLYREDFMCQQLPASVEHIEIQDIRKITPERKLRQLTPEQSLDITPPKSAFQFVAQQQQASPLHSPTTQRTLSIAAQKHTTNSLESRQKYRDTSATDWHMRRKSYGFEKMSPPDDKSMFGMDASTDSGLGRSGELGNWSPTESTPATVRGTVIQFGEPAKSVSNTSAVQRRYRQLKPPAEPKHGKVDEEDEDPFLKRHSIAVDESQYVRDNLRKKSQVHLNGFFDSALETIDTKSLQPARFDSMLETSSSASLFQRNSQQKRVEFCKTEVHFAAESGRVNIVETDGKPPPTNNFRRRRRTSSGPLQSLVKSATTVSNGTNNSVALPITHFGDDHRRKTIATTTVAYKASLVDAPQDFLEPSSNVTVSIPKVTESHSYSLTESSRNSYASTSGVDTTDCEADELSAIRGILKNKPIKPKPYHLGENIESTDALWGVQLKPIAGSNSFASRRESASKADSPPNKSVAERVRIVEKRQDHLSTSQSNGYSTKINLSLGEAQQDWAEPGVHDLTQRRPSVQELMLQDLREHQRILDEGLKSTSLIIKTMRSATEFDEAMRRLSIASIEAAVIPPIVVPTPMLRSNSYQETSRRYSNTSLDSNEGHQVIKSASYTSTSSLMSSTTRRSSTDSTYSIVQPVAAPRLKLLGNTDIPVSQQLSQLRRMYDRAASQDEDSADEEVKSYFRGHYDTSDSGGGTQESSSLEDERSIEYSSSWSRLKAKRTIWKIEADERKQYEKTLQRTELPKSNVMNIELHSPKESLKVLPQPPVAKPRTVSNAHPQVHTATTVKQSSHLTTTTNESKEPLKIIKEARGARKLRDHELSYFGVPPPKNDDNEVAKTKLSPSTTTNPKRSLPSRSRSSHSKTSTTSALESGETKQTTKWQLINDKPDLLRHSPIAVEPQVITRTAEIKPTERKSLHQNQRRTPVSNINESDEDELEDYDEHFYENITNELTPVFKVKSNAVKDSYSYDRKMDLKRDAMILSEMTRNADQTLKAITDEAALKDQRRRSLQRRNSKPLETIDEKTIAEKINDSCIAVKVSRSTHATSDSKRNSRHSTPSPTLLTTVASRARSSSQSSVESCPRARSRSLSSEREYENVKVKPTRSCAATRSKSSKAVVGSRSSSHESLRSSRSSGDENVVAIRRDERERLRSKMKRSNGISTSSQSQPRDKLKSKEVERRERKYQSTTEKQQQRASSTVHSSQKERIECATEPHLQHSHHRPSGAESGSGRRRRDETDLRKSTATTRSSSASMSRRHGNASTTAEKHHDERSTARGVSSSRGHEQERSSHRADRSDKDKEKLSRSRGQSSRSKSERQPSAATPTSTKTREHSKSTVTSSGGHDESKHNDTMTHSKNAQLLNGHQYGHQGQHQHHHHQQHPMTTTTIAAKHRRERSGKDRK